MVLAILKLKWLWKAQPAVIASLNLSGGRFVG
jgi:hypothetical protein